MKSLFATFAFAVALSSPLMMTGCKDDDSVDSVNGKAISDIDIGGDITLDKGATQQMTATVEYADGTSKDVTSDSSLVWNIGDTGVATISSSGLVTGVSIGATKIKATYQGKESSEQALIVK